MDTFGMTWQHSGHILLHRFHPSWPWAASPINSQKQLDYMEEEIEMKRQEREQNFSVEPENIHQIMYEIATKNQSTTLHLDPIGGSENFQGGSENVQQ